MAGLESLLIGRVLGGRYRVEEVIGRGGMGAVYRALDERLGRQVALKVITAGTAASPEARERLRARFFREARSAAALPHHPNVVPVYDYGSDEALGLDYIVMELLRGSDLASRLASSTPPPLAASLKILIEAAQGIAVGHRQGLIHRDVKPGNIFLTDSQQVRVVDFGIAKLADDDDTLGHLTQDGGAPHSPAFASPEQLRGVSHLTPASDVFSLGAVAYQLLVGERAFSDADRNQMSLGMAVEAPSLRSRNPAIPGPIDAIVRKALASEPEERYQDAGEMATALSAAFRALGDLPIEPYLAASTTFGGTPKTRSAEVPGVDDRTPISEPDDMTLAAPPAPPAQAPGQPGVGTASPGPTRQTPAPPAISPRGSKRPAAPASPRRAPQSAAKRGMGGTLLWILVLGGLAAGGFWAWSVINQAPQPFPDMAQSGMDSLNLPMDSSSIPADSLGLLEASLANVEGMRLYRAEQYVDAYLSFRNAVRISPNVAEFHRNAGLTLVKLGRYAQAVDELNQSLRLDPNPNPPDAFSALGQAQIFVGDTVAGLANLNEYLRRETVPYKRNLVAPIVERITAAQAGVQLLGEEVVRPTPGDAPGTPATPAPTPPPAPDTPVPGPTGAAPAGAADPASRRG